MKKIIYLLAILFYAGVGLLGAAGNGYSELGGTERIIKNNLLLMLSIALLVGALVSFYFPNMFPESYAKQNKGGKIFIAIIFLFLSFVFTVGIFLFANASLGHRSVIPIKGVVEKKWYSRKQKGRDYYLALRDSVSGAYYEFRVKKGIYYQIGVKGDKVSKDFYKGSLGVIYRYSF